MLTVQKHLVVIGTKTINNCDVGFHLELIVRGILRLINFIDCHIKRQIKMPQKNVSSWQKLISI